MPSYKKVSLSDINQSIETSNNNHFWQNLKAFLGPGALVAIGYFYFKDLSRAHSYLYHKVS